MTIDIEYETEMALGIDHKSVIDRVVLAVLDCEKCPYEAQVNILITDSDNIRQINREYRGIDAQTDVLSFPVAEYKTPADFNSLSGQMGCFHPETGELLLGDIVLSVERVIAQAKEYGHSRERELGFLVAHSMLHLLGYDHIKEDERLIMEQRQRDILEGIGLKR
ncbi:MAG: rRNA maturation RNase YbeY [Lachnospiraceae bacterium]|nr:rRNA maturation RNase YbeY [Lachnospiraceae bacterium]